MTARLIAAVVLSVAVHAAQAQPVDLAPGNQSLALDLPDAAFGHESAALSVDLDGYDVTTFSRLDGTRLHVDLATPLDAGKHALTVFLFHADGNADVVIDVVLDAPVISGGDWQLNTLFETNFRADESAAADYDGVDSVANSGSVEFSASRYAGGWNTGASVATLYDKANEDLPGGDAWLLPSYELYGGYAGESAEAWAVAGNIAVTRDDLLFSQYQRRGAALEGAAGSGNFKLRAFSVSSQPRSRFDGDYVLPSDSNEKTAGVTASAVMAGGHVEFGGGFVDGKSRFGGDGYNLPDDALVYGGDSWNLTFDGRWLDDNLWVRVERAESDFDADGIGIGLPEQSDDALQALLQLTSGTVIGAGPFEYWSAVLRHREVGYDYYALGNLSLPGNIAATSAWLQGGFTSVVVDLELAEEKTNPDDNPLWATQTLQRRGLTVAWSPATLDTESGPWKTLGAPSLSAWVYRIENSQPDSDALLAGFDVDNRTDDAGLSLTFARDGLAWSLEYGVVDYDDRSATVIDNGFVIYEPYSDSRNRNLSLSVSWMPAERIALDAYVQRNRLEETDFGDEYVTTNYGVSGNFVLVPEKLSLFASLSRDKDRSEFGDVQFAPEQYQSGFANVQLNWSVTEAAGPRPAINLFFKGNYGRNENLGLMLDDHFWAIYVGASLNWTGSK